MSDNSTPTHWWGNTFAAIPHGIALLVMFAAWTIMAYVYLRVEPWVDMLQNFEVEPPMLTDFMARWGGYLGENPAIVFTIWGVVLFADVMVLTLLTRHKLAWGIWHGIMMVLPIVVGLTAVYGLRILPRHQLAAMLDLDAGILPSVNDHPALKETLLNKKLSLKKRREAGWRLRTLGQIARTKIILPLKEENKVTTIFLQVADDETDDLSLRTTCAVWAHVLLDDIAIEPQLEIIAQTYAETLRNSTNTDDREMAAKHAGDLKEHAAPLIPVLIDTLGDESQTLRTIASDSLVDLVSENEDALAKVKKAKDDSSLPESIRKELKQVIAKVNEQ